MATGLERTAVSPHTMQAGQAAPPRPSLTQTATNPLARAYQLYQQYVGEPFQQAVRGGVRGYFGLPMMTDASSVGREAYRQGEALGFTPGVGMPAGAVRVAAEGMQALPSIAGDIGRVIGGLPSGAAARQAEDFAAYQRSIPPSDVSPLTAFHGTPHTFAAEEGAPLGRFRAGKIGSGEGAQSFGYGLYFAENPGVAKGYRSDLAGIGIEYANDAVKDAARKTMSFGFTDPIAVVKSALGNHGDVSKAINTLRTAYSKDEYLQAHANYLANLLESGAIKPKPSGSLYTVDIPDKIVDKMLDWDKPLSQQPESVKQAMRSALSDVIYEDFVKRNKSGADAYERLSQLSVPKGMDINDETVDVYKISDAAASKKLSDFGVPGIRYLDQGSRADGQGTRNIVVFPGEEQNVKILSRE